jgi:DNA mismatch endonuclease (patch repair protein)
MADNFSHEQRSDIMRQVKSRGNKSTELKLIQYFKIAGIIGWRRSYKIFGKPDFAFPKWKIAVFVDGCFWHGHSCRNTIPKDNEIYWQEKIRKNKNRDSRVNDTLLAKGWYVIRVWECELKNIEFLNKLFSMFFF